MAQEGFRHGLGITKCKGGRICNGRINSTVFIKLQHILNARCRIILLLHLDINISKKVQHLPVGNNDFSP